ncbi:MAG TPA: hypothetical protein VHX17_10580 [Candidatus Cybelea sp.]|jgi:hypothetical protein|nr:hypothetical protein [Candidatus Cybelea sp.]
MSRRIVGGISLQVPLFPPEAPLTILLNGHPLPSYVAAFVLDGRVVAPADPLLTRLADRIWIDADVLVVERGSTRVRVPLERRVTDRLDGAYVAVGPVLRALGASLTFDRKDHRLLVGLPQRANVVTPTPFNPALPSAAPSEVFTPEPPVTPRPLWTGSPLPRRTPLPYSSPGPGRSGSFPHRRR